MSARARPPSSASRSSRPAVVAPGGGPPCTCPVTAAPAGPAVHFGAGRPARGRPPAGAPRQTVAVADPDGVAGSLNAAATASPQASVILGRVLRITEALPVPDALAGESLAYSTLLGGPEFARWLAGRAARATPPPAGDPVLVRRDGAILRVTLNRPERRNAYSRGLRDALADALRVAQSDPAITRVVLDGAGPCFCSGGDLDEFGTTPDPVTAHFIRTR